MITMESTEETSVSAIEEAPKETTPPKEKSPLPFKEVQPKRSKRTDRHYKKEERAFEQFMKSLDGMPSADEKLSMLLKKFSEMAEENRRMQMFEKQIDKRLSGTLKEKEQLQLEYNRTVLVKSKLENLCRELQKQNKSIKEESLLKIREEEERRKETQAKFQSALSEITTLLQQNNEKNTKLRDDNINMSTKFKSVVEKYELREQQIEKMAKQMLLEQQLSEAKLAKASLEAQADRERLLSDRAQLKLELGQCHARIVESQGTEASLRSQLAVYTDKYDEFQNALVKSNQVFGGFKGEMEKMSKKIMKLEKECMSWKKRWETSQVALLEMATDKRLWDERAAASERQLGQLQRLCRSMQAERTLLLNTLKDHNIERPPLPVLPPAPPLPVAAPAAPSKVDAMAANCAQLKQSLAHLQNQLNVLTTKKEEENQTKAEQPTTGKSKKGKGKKSKADKEKLLQENVTANPEVSDDKTTQKQVTKQEIIQASSPDIDVKPTVSPVEVKAADSTVKIESGESTVEVKSVDSPIETKTESSLDAKMTELPIETKPVELAVDVNPVESTDQVKPIESSDQVKPAELTDQVKPIESTDQVKPLESADQVNPIELTDEVNLVVSPTKTSAVESSVEVKPVVSAIEVEPIEPSMIIEPVDNVDSPVITSNETTTVESSNNTKTEDNIEENKVIVTNGSDSNITSVPRDVCAVLNGETNGTQSTDEIDAGFKVIADKSQLCVKKDTALNPLKDDAHIADGKHEPLIQAQSSSNVES